MSPSPTVNHATPISVEYTDEFQLIDQLVNDHDADADAPQRQGAAPFQWSTVLELCQKIASQCADLRVGIWMLRAAMATQPLSGVSQALQRLATWCELPAERLFPQAEDGDDARELHALTLNWLSSPAAVYALGNTALHAHWPLTLAALANSPEALHTDEAINAQVLADASTALAATEAIESFLSQGTLAQSLSLGKALGLLRNATKRLTPPDGKAATDEGTAEGQDSTAQRTCAHHGPLANRDDVQQALAEIISYFKTHEPGHPAPLFLTRVQRMLGASFEDLMRELYQDAPQLVAKLEKPASH